MANSMPPQKYVMLEQQSTLQPPPYRRNVPRYHSGHHKSGGGCLKCICCCYCFLIILIFLLAGITFYFYTVFQPKVPSYQVERLDVKAFDMKMDFSLNTEFLVTVKADNPNQHIGFIYGKDSSAIVMYSDSQLCSGQLPAFHQGPKNITLMKVVMKGKSEFGSGLQQALIENREKGKIPLLIKVVVPVRVVVGSVQMRQFKVLVNCSLVIDNLAPKKKVRILSTKYAINVLF
ncbi:hypothetical protein PVL29_015465 [Vitis rotundifolia]|uniref:Late embryogenesis abundant protein LEA-2 subgroup domain-containing protein n=1 Tax=Vitis rotundifolia TaxID=103349 RepID=A0AA39DJT4_VITRO|nr:hypothetical protein PVL29_015465 [Vitis rotundifolia]